MFELQILELRQPYIDQHVSPGTISAAHSADQLSFRRKSFLTVAELTDQVRGFQA